MASNTLDPVDQCCGGPMNDASTQDTSPPQKRRGTSTVESRGLQRVHGAKMKFDSVRAQKAEGTIARALTGVHPATNGLQGNKRSIDFSLIYLMPTVTHLRWLLVAGLLGAGTVGARRDVLFTSAVTYCAPPENVLVQELDIRYYKENASVVFDVTASSLRDDLRVSLSLNLTVYGMQPVSLDLNLCDLASAVCPLPLYNFSGQGTLPIPDSFSSKIPTIGYTVPDLEAYAQLELLRVDTGEVAACVSATLSNGWSMRQPGATWSAVGVVLFSIVTSALWSMSKAKWRGTESGNWADKELWRVVDIVSFVQMIGISALLNLNYPSAYRAFAENFPWVLLLTGPIPSQSAIDHLRQRTGARLGDDALPTDEYAYAQLELLRVDTGEVAACVSATLSNGWSMLQPGATWSAVGVVLFSIVTSALWSMSKAKWRGTESGNWADKELWRVVDIISFVQMIGISALLNLNYPSAYRAFAENFPWVLLLTGPIPSQSAIDHLRQRTGARLGDDALPTDEYVNRRLSPYNQNLALGSVQAVAQNVDLGNNYGYSFTSTNATGLGVLNSALEKRVFINPATVTEADALPGGVPVYVNGAGVATANAFLGVFFEWLVIGAIVLGVCIAYQLWKRTIGARTRLAGKGQISSESLVPRVSNMLHGMFLRLALVLILPVTVFTMYQWTLRDSWLATLLSVICILTTWAGLGWTWFKLSLNSRSLDDTRRLAALRPSFPMIALLTIPIFITSLFVAFASRSGTAQVAGILAIEILSLGAAIFIRWQARRRERDLILNATPESPVPNLPTPFIPPPTRMGITLRWFRVVAMGLMIPFIESLGVKPIPRTVIGIVTAAVWGIGVVIIFAYLVWSTVQFFRRKRVDSSSPHGASTDRIAEKGVASPASAIAEPLSPTQPDRTNSGHTLYYDAHTGATPAPGLGAQQSWTQLSQFVTHHFAITMLSRSRLSPVLGLDLLGRGRCKSTKSSTNWLARQAKDPYVKQRSGAGPDGVAYRARSAFKLIEIDKKFRILRPGQVVCDLGAAPGGWTQVAAQRIKLVSKPEPEDGSPISEENEVPPVARRQASKLIAVDLLSIQPISGVHILRGDFTSQFTQQRVSELVGDRRVDVVLSDMCANLSGNTIKDTESSLELCQMAFGFAMKHMKIGADGDHKSGILV
ncbi:ML-like domain, partial [Rhizoctonia solani]